MKPKVAIIGVKGLPGFGGSARANNEILPILANSYEITVYAIDTHANQEYYQGIRQHIFKSNKNLKINSILYFLKSLIHVFFKSDYDFVHLNHGVSGFILPFLRLRFKVIISIRGLNYNGDDKWNSLEYLFLKTSEWLAFNLSDYVTTVQKSSVRQIEKRTNKPVFYIPNGIKNYHQEYSNTEKENVITLSAARLIYLKGVHDFLDALQKIHFQGKVRIIGDLNHVPKYKVRILKLSEGLDVEFTGLIKDQRDLFEKIASSRLYVFPSYSEGMSNMLLEVASLKIPIIASDIIPNKDVFNDNELIYFPVGDSDQLAKKIEYYWNNPKLSNNFADKAYSKLLSVYNWKSVALQYDEIYSKMVK